MTKLVFDPSTRRCIGVLSGGTNFDGPGILVDVATVPADLSVVVLASDGAVVEDTTAALAAAKAARIARVKQEAFAAITATDWRVTRARERAEAGVQGDQTVAQVLALREAIRQASSNAEATIQAMTDVAAVNAFTWQAA